jgi:excisionase family DNA binding protein
MSQAIETKKETCATKEAASLLSVTTRTIPLWAEAGILPAWKTPGGHRRFRVSDIEALQKKLLGDEINQPKLKLLVIEDEPDLLTLYRFNVEGWTIPVELQTASDGYEGLLKIGAWQPDMIVTDLQMPNMDGFYLLQVLNRQADLQTTEIIVVSALSKEDIKEKGGVPEGIEVYQKPIPFDLIEQHAKVRLDNLNSRRPE